MVTQKEFLEIVEKHLTIDEDGKVVIKDPELTKKYTEYLKEKAVFESNRSIIDNAFCGNILC